MALSAVQGDSTAIVEELLQFYCKFLRIYFIGIYRVRNSEVFVFVVFFTKANLVFNTFVKYHQ